MGASAVSGALGGISLIGGASSARSAASAANNQASIMEQLALKQRNTALGLAEPYISLGSSALPRLAGVSQMYADKVGKDDPTLTQSLNDSLTGINRQQANETALSAMKFGSIGNTGAEYGANLRAERSAQDSTNSARLGYAQAQDSYKQTNLSNYASSLGAMAQLGQAGTSQALGANSDYYGSLMQANSVRNQAAQDQYGDLADIFGQIGAYGLDAYTNKKKNALGALSGSSGSGSIKSGSGAFSYTPLNIFR